MAQEVSSSPNTLYKFLISHQNVPFDELLGSVTTYNSVEGSETKSLQLRQSARVFKKMRLDSAAIAAATSVLSKPATEGLEKAKELDKLDTKKPLRPLWLPEDKTLFFEALNEHGKDFEAIHSYMKLKKKGAPENAIKTREQIRHLYHRTWHKISKHLVFSEGVKKVAQELYGLINYGELRKKLVSVSPKTTIKLNELIYRGSMTLRVKGKTIRIKTPMCRALRRLNQLDEKHDDIKLPTRILVDLKPKDMATWMHVQEMSQNPRVRTAVPLQKRLSTLIQCMSDRWKTQNSLDFDRMIATLKDSSSTLSASHDSKVQDTCMPTEDYDDKRKLFHSLLRLSPVDGAPIHIPNINLSELFTSLTICMNAYERRVGATSSGEALWLKAFPGFRTSYKNFYKKAAAAIKRQRSESCSVGITQSPPNKVSSTSVTTTAIATITTTIDNNDYSEGAVASSSLDDHLMDEYIDEAVNTILALQTSMNGGEALTGAESANEELEARIKIEDEEQCQQLEIKRIQNIEKVKLGWTIAECRSLSIGDLYLMFGSDSKLELEYSFCHHTDIKPKLEPIDLTDTISTSTHIPNEPNNTDVQPSSTNPDHQTITNDSKSQPMDVSLSTNSNASENATRNDLSATLKRLLSVAKLHYRRNIVRCPCGHVCNGNATSRKEHQRQQKCVNGGKGMTGRIGKGDGAEMVTIDGTVVEGIVMETVAVSTSSIIPVPIQPMFKRYQPNTLFRRPNSPNDCLRAQIDSIQRLKPRYGNRMGRRLRTKQMVVERRLALMPNINESGRQIVQMNIISQDNSINMATSTTSGMVQPRKIVQTQPEIKQSEQQQQEGIMTSRAVGVEVGIMTAGVDVCDTGGLTFEGTLTEATVIPTTFSTIPPVPPELTDRNGDNATTPSRVCSPTSISNLLDMAINSAQSQLDSERKEGSTGNITSFQGLISQSDKSNSCTPPDSPSQLLKDADSQQWLNSEVADYSLSSLLGHLESPMKTVQSGSSINGDDTRLLSQDVDAQLRSLLTESSLDYTRKFADLAAQVSDSKNKETFSNT